MFLVCFKIIVSIKCTTSVLFIIIIYLFFQVFTGVGFAICVSCMFQSIVDMSVITWSAQAFYLLFTGQVFTENFFYGQVLDWEDGSGLDNLGTLHGQLSLCLGIACLVIFILIAAGTRSIGKVRFLLEYCNLNGEDIVNFCGLLRKHEL